MEIPTARKLTSGNWHIQLRLSGKSISILESTQKKCEAEAKLIKAKHKAGKLEAQWNDTRTLYDIIDEYIISRENTLSPASIRNYTKIRDHNFKNYSKMKITDIKDWQKVCDEEAKYYSGKSVKSAFGLVKASLKYANFPVPTKITLPQVISNKRPYLDFDQIKVFVDALKGDEYQIPALLALHSLRSSELFALKWEKSINLKDKEIVVSGSKVRDKDDNLVERKGNKSVSSKRTVPIMIDDLYIALIANKKAKGPVVADITQKMLYDRINRICKQNDLPLVGVHGLRHSFASLCYHLRVPEIICAQMGGWDDIKTMHEIYTHISKKDISKHAKDITDFFNGASM